MTLGETAVSAAVLIAVIVVIRALAINRLPKTTFIVLWGIALARLLVPFTVSSQLSIFNLFTGPAQAADGIRQAAATGTAEPAVAETTTAGVQYTQPDGFTISPILAIWLAGAAAIGLIMALGYIKCYREFKTSLPADDAGIAGWLGKNTLLRKVQVRVSDKISGPLTYGVFRPVILLPKTTDWGNRRWLDYVLAHELIHIRRFDTLIKMALAAAVCIHWFNPMAWVMYILANRDLELSCDEKVIRQFGESSAAQYALTLVSLQEKHNRLPLANSGFGRYAIIERITAIMKTKKIP